MALSEGTRLGPYEILAATGAGGMGEVYRARDTKLKRTVAIKVLPEAFSHDPDRLARFEREAELIADGRFQIEEALSDPVSRAAVTSTAMTSRERVARFAAPVFLSAAMLLAAWPSATSSSGDAIAFSVFPHEKTVGRRNSRTRHGD